MIRRDILHYITKLVQSVIVVQRNVRSYLLSKAWKTLLSARLYSSAILQRSMRRFLAYRVAAILRAQKSAEWEQLWDSRRGLLYYYNYVTGVSQYDEPMEYFRPLVRDPRTAALMQAWPELESQSAGVARLPPASNALVSVSEMSTHAMCGICNVRKCVRICMECTDEVNMDPTKHCAFPYCFTCFMKEHAEDKEDKVNHQYQEVVTSEDAVPVLRCCLCDELAVRKCLGMLDDAQIDDICHALSKSKPENWVRILSKANVAGERKLELMMEQVKGDAEAAMRTEDQRPAPAAISSFLLQSIRTLLERTRAECDECYCQNCYEHVHAGGKRALHKWRGFQGGAPVCTVCTNTPAEMNCFDCECQYCGSCYKVFHNMGRKRRHKKEKILEDLAEEGQEYCHVCQRRVGTISCENDRCGTVACDSCYLFKHKPLCDKELLFEPQAIEPSTKTQQSEFAVGVAGPISGKGGFSFKDGVCVVCGEGAEIKCVQCGDLYCSRTWMGNPGCFASHHSKGNRASHTMEKYFSRRLLASRSKSRAQLQSAEGGGESRRSMISAISMPSFRDDGDGGAGSERPGAK